MTRFYVNAIIALGLGLLGSWPVAAGYFIGFVLYIVITDTK